MGKKKKKTERFDVDFKKQKDKAGKRKAAPNATNTNFRSKAIQMPDQSIMGEKGELVSSRNLSLKELLGQVKHYNATIRRDALLGLLDLFSRHQVAIALHLRSVVERVMECMLDGERPVRQALHTLLKGLIAGLGPAQMRVYEPFLPLSIMYTKSAMTHRDDSVRRDALLFIDLWSTHFPASMAFVAREILPNFTDLLSFQSHAGGSDAAAPDARSLSTNPRSKLASPEARNLVLTSLRVFLAAVFRDDSSDSPTAAAGVAQQRMPHRLDASVPWSTAQRGVCLGFAAPPPQLFPSVMSAAGAASSSPAGAPKDARVRSEALGAALRDFGDLMLPLLLECWLELGPADPLTAPRVSALSAMVEVIRTIMRHAAPRPGRAREPVFEAYLGNFEKYFALYFPFATPAQRKDQPNLGGAVLALNVGACEVMAHFLPLLVQRDRAEAERSAAAQWALRAGRADGEDADAPSGVRAHRSLEETEWAGDLFDFVANGLSRSSAGSGTASASTSTLLSLVSSFVRVAPPSKKADLISGFAEFYRKCHPLSKARQESVTVLATMLLDEARFAALLPGATVAGWLGSLPKMLWQLQAEAPQATSAILLLLSTFARTTRSSEWRRMLQDTQLAMAPFFFSFVQKKGGAKVPIFGPFVALPEREQLLALDLLYYYDALSETMLRSLAACCNSLALGSPAVGKAMELLGLAVQRGALAPASLLSFAFTLLSGESTADSAPLRPAAPSRKRAREDDGDEAEGPSQQLPAEARSAVTKEELSDAVCRHLARLPGRDAVLGEMSAFYTDLLASVADYRYLYGVLLAASALGGPLPPHLRAPLMRATTRYASAVLLSHEATPEKAYPLMSPVRRLFLMWPALFGEVLEVLAAEVQAFECDAATLRANMALVREWTHTPDLAVDVLRPHREGLAAFTHAARAALDRTADAGAERLYRQLVSDVTLMDLT